MDSATLKDVIALVTPALMTIIGAGIAMIGYFLKSLHREIKSRFIAAEQKTDRVERDFMEFKTQLPKQYVLKDDYIRTISGVEYKLDSLDKKIDTLLRREI
ncbi:MAG: hypothetical protein HZB80_11365 [Deltaproteobacteria bacterium]|nr:hypothetical protein [Deltaproteobacteria bacterium]